jgi:hypothetical protein
MRRRYFNLNIKHPYSDQSASAAALWLREKRAAPVFFRFDSFDDVMSDNIKTPLMLMIEYEQSRCAIWAHDIQLSVKADCAADLSKLLVERVITLDEVLARQEDKMLLSKKLRSLIVEHTRSTMSDFAWELMRREGNS